jgi:sugar/nucleoside kinase (ribokinase family)
MRFGEAFAGGRCGSSFKRGSEGGLSRRAQRSHTVAAGASLTGEATGSGDAFAGGFLSGLLAGLDLEQALDRAMISASFALEDWGPAGLLSPRRTTKRGAPARVARREG